MHVLSSSAIAALAFVGSANAWFRLTCGLPAIQTRADPIVQPGVSPSYHVHTVHGGKNFRSNATYDTLRASSCTSCLITQDLSSYWFPKLYFFKNGQFEAVPNGGLTAYYLQRGDGDKANGGAGLKAFPPGFKMIGGNALRRAKKFTTETGSQEELRERATKWECLRYTTSNPGYNGYGFPTTDCEAGFRAQLHFPACWDGKNLDSADHISHTAYLSGLDNGKCPSTHPVPLMLMFYEVTWDIHSFVTSGKWNPATDGWRFVYANGDPTGHGWHGDFQNGWDTTVLQTAIDKCNDPSNDTINGVAEACPYLKLQNPAAAPANACKPTAEINENVAGPFAKLPGCNPLQAGPADAKVYTDANCPA